MPGSPVSIFSQKAVPQKHIPQRSATCAAVRNPQNYYMPLDVSSRFGVRLRQLRRERNLTQSRMATEFGIDRTFISDVERGRKSISLPMLEILALGLKMSLSELLRDI
jgi:DNA-binding XRE family transcriptional regulator